MLLRRRKPLDTGKSNLISLCKNDTAVGAAALLLNTIGTNIANRLSKAGWSLGWVSVIDSQGQTIWIVDAHRGDGRRFVVHSDEKLSAFVELERQVLNVTFYLESIHSGADDQ